MLFGSAIETSLLFMIVVQMFMSSVIIEHSNVLLLTRVHHDHSVVVDEHRLTFELISALLLHQSSSVVLLPFHAANVTDNSTRNSYHIPLAFDDRILLLVQSMMNCDYFHFDYSWFCRQIALIIIQKSQLL